MLEFQEHFGGPQKAAFNAVASESGDAVKTLQSVDFSTDGKPAFFLYYAMMHYFRNGGGSCYVVSIGDYSASLAKKAFLDGLAAIEKEDEPTLLVAPEATALGNADFNAYCQQALQQCVKLKDRFSVLDIRGGDVVAFRNGVVAEDLSYGAAYHPYLLSSLAYQYEDEDVAISLGEGDTATDLGTLASIKGNETALYSEVKNALDKQRVVLPPSAAVTGAYASVDRQRGVWKAPANIGLKSVIKPVEQITTEQQESLNVDPTGGKSINAIRAFAGKGVLVWGARTLAGNDKEWRYVSVRRLFVMIEESVQKSTAFAVFEPNDATLWLKVKGMIEGYLYGLWEKGALQGPTPESAYFVNIGLNKTMSPQDVNDGRLIVEIGVAAVRPAEFIILQFMHKLAEA